METEAWYTSRTCDEILQGVDPVAIAYAPYAYGVRDTRYLRIMDLLHCERLLPRDHHYHATPAATATRRRRSAAPPARNDHRNNKRACIPASTNAILGLKEVLLTTANMDDGCAICLKALAAGEAVRGDDREDDDLKALAALLADREQGNEEDDSDGDDDDDDVTWLQPLRLRAMPCSHVFHQNCIFKWLSRNAVCPLCRYKLPTEDDDDDE